MTKDALLKVWAEAKGKDQIFFHTYFKKWLDEQPDIPLEAPKLPAKRTDNQNAALHLWLEMLAQELDKNGHTVQDVVARIKRAEIRPNKTVLKEVLWRPYQIAALGKESTTELTKHEVDKVYEGLNKFIGQEFEIHVPFPSDESKKENNLTITTRAKAMDYPIDPYEGKETGTF